MSSRFVLIVLNERSERFRRVPLPSKGSVSLGRGEGNDIHIDDSSVSRSHAVLHVGDSVEIEDLDSGNGTRIHIWNRRPSGEPDGTDAANVVGEPLAPFQRTPVPPGHAIHLGSACVVLQPAEPAGPRRVWTHRYFEERVAEECARRREAGGALCILRVSARGEPSIEAKLLELADEEAVVARYADGEFELLLSDSTAAQVDALVQSVTRRGASVRVGQAWFPTHGRTPDSLFAHAEQDVHGRMFAEDRSGEPAVLAAPAMRELYAQARQLASSPLSVLILGETGAGKEVLAEAVHAFSARAKHPFVCVNCAALTGTLLESELFGHQRGAFTGADREKPGLLEAADGGTLFLDEIAELPLALQAKLLRVLEDGRVRRVGAVEARPIDVRFVFATNLDLEACVASGEFRRDLYYRISGLRMVVPPLRERPEEIPLLVRHFVAVACRREGRAPVELSAKAESWLLGYAWPGNVRELRNAIERAVLLCGRGPIELEHLPGDKREASPATLDSRASVPAAESEDVQVLEARMQEAKRREVLDALRQCGGNQTRAARILGISRGTLIARMEAYGLPRPKKR
ncbi:MAG: sigma 54-interacting transcriptional regulator [Polyangiaceae bacterium]